MSNLNVKELGGKGSRRYERSVELRIRVNIESKPFEEDLEGRRARREEKALALELLVEEIRRAKRERAAEQQRALTLEVEQPPLP